MDISRRITRSQQKKHGQAGRNGANEGRSNKMRDQTSSRSAEPEQSRKEWPTVKRSTVMAVVVERTNKNGEEEGEGEGEAGKKAGKKAEKRAEKKAGKKVGKETGETAEQDEEAKGEVDSMTEGAELVKNGKKDSGEKMGGSEDTVNGIDTKPDDNAESITEKATDSTTILDKISDVNGKNADRILVEAALPEDDDNGRSDDNDAPEALSLSTGRQAILSQEAEVKRAQDSQKVATRLKRKALDARLKSQKARAMPQLPPLKRQKHSPTATSITTADINSTSQPVSTSSASTLQLSRSADSPPPPSILSPGSSTTLSHQPPSLSPTHPDFSCTRRIPLLPDSLLEEVSRLPSPHLPSAFKEPHKLVNTRKTFSDIEEEKTALVALEKKRKGSRLPMYRKGPVTVAVLGAEEYWEKERKIMAPPGSFTVKNIKQSWLMGRRLAGGERRPMHHVGGKSFVRK